MRIWSLILLVSCAGVVASPALAQVPPPVPSAAPVAPAIAPPPPARPKTLIVATKPVKPFAFKGPDGKWQGISVDLWTEIAGKIGREFEWTEAANTNALVDMVAAGKADVGIAAITMKPSRAEKVDFSNSMFTAGLGIAVRAVEPGIVESLGALFTMQFVTALLSLCALLFVVGVLIWLFERRANPEEFEGDVGKGLWSGFWWSAVTMTTVGYGDKSPRTVPGRIVGLIWMFASIIMISGFTAAIASSLTTQKLQSSVRGVEDLPNVRVGAKTGESPFEILVERGVSPTGFGSIAEGLHALERNEIDAFVHDIPVIQYEIVSDSNLSGTIAVLPKPIRTEDYGIAVRPPADRDKRNLLRDQITNELLAAKISGRYYEIVRHWLGE